MTDFLTGAKYAFSGFGLIGKPGVRLYVLLPLVINTLLFSLVIVYGAGRMEDFINRLIAQWAWLEWFTWLLWPFFVVISLIVVFFCFSIVANLIGAPFNGFLAAATESRLTGTAGSDTGRGLIVEMGMALKSEFGKFLYFVIRAVPLLLLLLIPVIGPVIWFFFGAWMMALEYLDYPMGNHGLFFPDIRARLREKRALAMGFGSGVLLLTMLPGLNFIAMPVAVAGATRLYLNEFKSS